MNVTRDRLVLAGILLVAAMLALGNITTGHVWGDDFSAYIAQAQAIVEGTPEAYLDANRFNYENSEPTGGPLASSWGLPILLAPFVSAFGLNMSALKMLGVLCFLVFLVVLAGGFRGTHSTLGLSVLLALFAVNPELLTAVDLIGSDVPFLMWSTATMFFLGRVVFEGRVFLALWLDRLMLGCAIGLAFLIRTNGLLLFGALVIGLVYRRTIASWTLGRHREAGRFAPEPGSGSSQAKNDFALAATVFAGVALVVVLAYLLLPGGGSSHIKLLRHVSLRSVWRNFLFYAELPAGFFAGVPLAGLFFGATIPCAIAGMSKRWRRDYYVVAYAILTFGLYIVWPSPQGLRFLYPILPFYFSFVITGLDMFRLSGDAREATFRRLVIGLPVVLVIALLAVQSSRDAFRNVSQGRQTSSGAYTTESQDMFAFVKENVAPGSSIVFWKPRLMRLLTGLPSRRVASLQALTDDDEYLCLYRLWDPDSTTLRYRLNDANSVLAETVDELENTGRLRLLYQNAHFRLYRLAR